MLSVEYIQDMHEFIALREEWNILLRQCPHGDPFFSWEWLATWWDFFGSQHQMMIIAVYENDTLVGLAPLMLRLERMWGVKIRVVSSIGLPPPDISGFLVPPNRNDVVNTIAESLTEKRANWDAVVLKEYSASSFDFEAFTSTFASYCTVEMPTSIHWQIPLDETWEAYLEGLSSKIKKDLRRCRRKLSELGEVVYSRYIGDEFKPEHLHALFEVNRYSHHPDDYVTTSQQAFHLKLGERLGQRGWIDLSLLSVAGKPIAYHYGFAYTDRASLWRTGFDTSYRTYSPGKLILLDYIEDSYSRGIKTIDWLRGDHTYKQTWQAQPTTYYHPVIVQKRMVPQFVLNQWPHWRHGIRKAVERNETIHRTLRYFDKWRYRRFLSKLDVASQQHEDDET